MSNNDNIMKIILIIMRIDKHTNKILFLNSEQWSHLVFQHYSSITLNLYFILNLYVKKSNEILFDFF